MECIGRWHRVAAWFSVWVLGLGSLGWRGDFGWAQDGRQEKTRPAFSAAQIEFFEKDVRPILVARCYECHDPSVGEVGGGLSLASRADILAGGDTGPAIEPGDPINSLLIEAVRHGERVQMPPDEKMPLEEIATLMQWIEQRAPWPLESDQRTAATEVFDLEERRRTHWSWQPLSSPAVPVVRDTQWPRQRLDSFILDRLEAAELTPAPPAAPAVWFRRAHLDLVGLPPTAEQVRDFLARWDEALATPAEGTTSAAVSVADRNRAATESLQQAVVDRLLASADFGEHWARHWLDLVRYAETCGHEFDYPLPGAFEYRDYVIRALNRDVPYDQWVREHIAGDLLASPRSHPEQGFNESVLGTMFWFLGEANHAPVDVRGDQANRIDNQIDVFGKTFLGLTVACARCHDHKFDAISAADYYALAGIVSGMRRDHAVVDTDRVQARYAEQARRQQREAERLMQQEWEGIAAWLNRPAASSPGPESVEPIAPAAQRERGLPASETADEPAAGRADSGPVAAMLRYLSDLPGEQVGRGPATGEDHPLRWINAYAKRPVGQPVGEWWDSFRQRILEQAQAAERFQAEATLVGDFSPSSRQSWWPSGLAFAEDAGERWLPTWLGEQVATTGRARWQAGQPGVWDSLRQGRSLAGTLRSPTFELTSDRLHLWVRGQDAKVRLVIDGYQMNLHHDLLFNQTLLTIQSPNFEWRTMQGDLGKYVGHRVYLELIDEGDGFVAIDQVWLGGDQPVVAPSPLLVQCCQSQASLQDLTQLAELTVAVLRAGATGQMIWPPEDDLPGPAVDQDADPREQKAGRREQKAGRVVVERGQSGGPITERVRETHGRVQRPSNLGRGRRTTVTPFDQALIQTWAWNWAPTAASPGDDWGAAALAADWAALDRQQAALAPPPVAVRKSWVAAGSEGWDHPLYIRGNHRNPGDLVPRGTLTALRTSGRQPERVGTSSGVTVAPEMRSRGGALDPSGRLAVAENIASPDNPLTARVMVNRIWLQLIGEGLVATPDDFGVMGAAPSHPELLDHLATQFVADGWSIKKMIRQIVLSQTYAMSVDGSPLAAERDPANQLRHRAQVRRLSGEVLRDAMLQISGRLDRQRHGPSVPTHVTELMQGRGRPESGPRDGNGRRSVYLEIRRNFLNPWMLVFDTPAPFSTMGKRTRSNVPAQALALLNDPLVHDLAATWAANVLTQAGTDRQRLEQMYWSALGRPLTDEEWPVFAAFLADFPAPDPGDEPAVAAQPTPERVAAWTQVAHALFNLKEFVFLN